MLSTSASSLCPPLAWETTCLGRPRASPTGPSTRCWSQVSWWLSGVSGGPGIVLSQGGICWVPRVTQPQPGDTVGLYPYPRDQSLHGPSASPNVPTVYLFLGLIAMMLVLQTFRHVSDLHGLTELILLPRPCPASLQEEEDDQVEIPDPQLDLHQRLSASSHNDYASIPR